MYQPWSFWLAWAIIVVGFVAVGVYVAYAERRDIIERDRWLAERDRVAMRRRRWMEEISDADAD